MKNKYAKRSRISEAKTREVVRYFAADPTALQAAALSGLNRNTVNRLYRAPCGNASCLPAKPSAPLFGTAEIDESFFGARRVKGRRGRGACGKTIVFGIFERQGQVYTEIVPDCSKPTLQSIIRGWVDPRTVINSDGWPGSTAWSTSAMATSGSIIPGMRGAPSTSTTSRASGAWPRSA